MSSQLTNLIILTGFTVSMNLSPVCSAFSESTVYYDLPETLEPNPIPAPTTDLANLPGYPNDANRLTLAARLYLPDANVYGDGPYPAIIVLHGSGGLWSNDVIANGLISQFEQWGELLAGMGYLTIFPDSYNPRGIPENFNGRRPHYDPAVDDDLCSPNYERPKDVIATLTYLQSRHDVDTNFIGLMGFSHGAQTAINAILDESVDLGQYTVSYTDLNDKGNEDPEDDEEFSTTKDVDSPVRIGTNLPFPKVCVFYYGGGSHYGYHGSANDTGAGRYMFDRRTKVLLFHGTSDFLMNNLYPPKQVLASSAQAAAEGVEDPLQHHFIFDGVGHSFDLTSIADPQDWNTNAESNDQKAKRLARDEVLKHFETYLKHPPQLSIAPDTPQPDEVQLTNSSTNPLSHYQWRWSDDLTIWNNLGNSFDGTGAATQVTTDQQPNSNRFFRLEYGPIAPPIDDPDNAGFFLNFSDLGL